MIQKMEQYAGFVIEMFRFTGDETMHKIEMTDINIFLVYRVAQLK